MPVLHSKLPLKTLYKPTYAQADAAQCSQLNVLAPDCATLH
jgi:hypothetical protein